MMTTAHTGQKPPYISFSTLLAQVERMEAGGVPEKIERTFLSSMSSAYQSQVISSLQYLGLVDNTGAVMPALRELVSRTGDRPGLIEALLRQRYPWALAVALNNGTHSQLEDEFRKQGLTGDTLRKATMFFIHAALYAGLPVSQHVRTGRGRSAGSPTAASGVSPRARRRVKDGGKAMLTTLMGAGFHPNPNTKTVKLSNGGLITLSVNVDIFTLSQEDRQFVLDLVDRINGYQTNYQKRE